MGYDLFSMEPKIRKAQREDLSQIYNLVNQLSNKSLDRTIFSKKYKSNLKDRAIEYWVLEVNGKIMGFISVHSSNLLHHDTIVNEIQEFVIDASLRGNGLGGQLLRHIIDRFKAENLELSSNISRQEAKRFYQKNGFVCTHNKFVLPPTKRSD